MLRFSPIAQGDFTGWRVVVDGDFRSEEVICLEPEFERIMDEFTQINRRDFRLFVPLPVNVVVCHDDIVLARGPVCRRRAELIGEDGMLMCFMPGTPMGMLYRVYAGVETLAYLYADAPDALADLFSVMERRYEEWFRLAVDGVADAFVSMDDTSTTVISPPQFEAFAIPVTDRRAEICHQAGKLYFHHSCGLIRDLLPLYRRTKMDAVHAFTVPPAGDVWVKAGREALGDRITIIADVAPMAEAEWRPPSVRDGVKRLFAEAPQRPLHPEPGCLSPPDEGPDEIHR